MLRYPWYSQRGLRPVCTEKTTQLTGWRMHYCVPRTSGGFQTAFPRKRSKGLSRVTENSHTRFLVRGLDGSNPVRLLDLIRRRAPITAVAHARVSVRLLLLKAE